MLFSWQTFMVCCCHLLACGFSDRCACPDSIFFLPNFFPNFHQEWLIYLWISYVPLTVSKCVCVYKGEFKKKKLYLLKFKSISYLKKYIHVLCHIFQKTVSSFLFVFFVSQSNLNFKEVAWSKKIIIIIWPQPTL